jgi:CheY-like chemotaxis protein
VWSRESIVEEMATALWFSVAPSSRTVPRQLYKAGEDLAALYEEANRTSLSDIGRRMHAAAADLDAELAGVWLAEVAIGNGDDHAASVISAAGIGVPTFELHTARSGHTIEVTWDGSAARRNPASSGEHIMLLEDDPILQEGTGRWLKRMYPGTPLLVVDNVEAAIANLKHHDISLIVSDVDVVGNQNGIDLFHYVQQNYPALVDKYVFFTGNSAAEKEHYRYLAKGAATSKDLKAAIAAPAPGGRTRRGTKAPAPAARSAPTVQQVVEVVRDVAPTIQPEDGPDGRPRTRFGDRKIFISAMWRAASRDPRMAGLSFYQFKQALVAAHRERMLTLARADFVAAMDNAAVVASETAADGATFNFVIDPSVGRTAPAAPRAPVYISPPPRSAAPRAASGQPSVEQIAQAVLAALPSIKGSRDNGLVGRFGESKVFIGAIWPIVSRQYPDLTRGQFDHALLTANREGLLVLARLDLRGEANREMIETSEISDGSYTVHFVVDPNGPGW